jgi:hypothetical protein
LCDGDGDGDGGATVVVVVIAVVVVVTMVVVVMTMVMMLVVVVATMVVVVVVKEGASMFAPCPLLLGLPTRLQRLCSQFLVTMWSAMAVSSDEWTRKYHEFKYRCCKRTSVFKSGCQNRNSSTTRSWSVSL